MKNELLSLLKADKGYISGEDIGNILGVSRAAVWKGIKGLRDEGYEIEAVTNKGYRLKESGDLLNAADVQSELTTDFIGRNLIVYDTVDSTNNVVRVMAFEKAEEGSVVIAHEQTLARGRRGKGWVSLKGEGLWMSVLLKPTIGPNDAPKITLVAGLSVCQALRELGFNADIKWPNDIIISGKKVCGILTEMSAQMDYVEFVVVGIGINVNNEKFQGELENVAISLKMVSGQEIKRSVVGAHVLNRLEKNYSIYLNNGFLGLKDEYEKNCITLMKDVEVLGKESFKGRAVALTDEGELIVRKETGEETVVFSGDVSVRGVM